MSQAGTVPAASDVRFNRFLALVYLIMAVGMVITAAASSYISSNQDLMKRILFASIALVLVAP